MGQGSGAGSHGDGDAIADATPPTLRQNEIPKSPIPATRSPAPHVQSPAPRVAMGSSHHRPLVLPVPRADLSGEKILRDAPIGVWDGAPCPVVGGIPLLAKLGQGGMGSVYLGVHMRLNSFVAVKVLPSHLADQDPTLIQRFFREAQVAAQVRSDHVAHVFDVNEGNGIYFLVMEYVLGCTGLKLLQIARSEGKAGLAEVEALRICLAATQGLHLAHSMDIIHRDIKPDNIMIPYKMGTDKELDYDGAKLMDLGLARVQASENSGLTATESAMGTPGYMAPEQALDARHADGRADIFSMGATLYALVSGKSPFYKENPMKTLMATIHEPPAPLQAVRPDVNPIIQQVIEKCLAKSPENRYPNTQAMLNAFRTCSDLLQGKTRVSTTATIVPPSRQLKKTQPVPPPSPAAIPTPPANVLTPTFPTSPPNRVGWYIGGGLAGAVLLGFAVYTFVPGPQKTQYTATQLREMRMLHEENVVAAKDHATKGNFARAHLLWNQARDISAKTGDLELEKNDEALKAFIAEREQQQAIAYTTALEQLDRAISQQEFKTAQDLLLQAQTAAPHDEVAENLLKLKAESVSELKRMKDHEKRIEESLELAKVLPPDAGLETVEQARALLSVNVMKGSRNKAELERTATALHDQFERTKADARTKKEAETKEAAFLRALADADNLMQSEATLSAAETRLSEAARIYKDDVRLGEPRKRLEMLKAEPAKREMFQNLLAGADKLIEDAKLDEAETQLKKADELYSKHESSIKLFKKLAERQDEVRKASDQKQKREEFKNLIAKVDDLLQGDALDEAAIRLESARKLDDASPELAARETKLKTKRDEAKRQAELTRLLSAIDTSLKGEGDLAAADQALAAAMKLHGTDERVKSAAERVKARRQERETRASFAAALIEADKKLNEDDLVGAQAKLAEAKRLISDDPALEAPYRKLASAQKAANDRALDQEQRKDFNLALKAADDLMAKEEFAQAETKIAEAAKLFPKEIATLADANTRLITAKTQFALRAEEKKRAQLDAQAKQANDQISKGAFAEAAQSIAALESANPTDTRVATLKDMLQKRRDFVAAITAAETLLAQPSFTTAAVQEKISEAEKISPGDPRVLRAKESLAAKSAPPPEAVKPVKESRRDPDRQPKERKLVGEE